MPRSLRLLVSVTVLLLAAAGGFLATSALAPERLQQEVEGWLERATRADAEIASLRLVVGFPIRLEGTGLRLYDGALTVEQASARIDVVSLLLGRPRLTRLRLDGAHLMVTRSPEGIWDPPIFRPSNEDVKEPALAALRAIEGATRFLLTKPLLADALVVRRSRVSLEHADPAGSGAPVRVAFESVNGRLLHSRLFGDARLFLRVRLVQGGQERGRLEWSGTRDDEGAMQVTAAATGVDLSTLETYVRGAKRDASLEGTLDGVADFATAEQGVGQLSLDLAARDFETSLGPDADGAPTALRLPEVSLRMHVDLDRERVLLSKASIRTGDLDFSLDANVARPLGDASAAAVTVSLADLAMAPETARKLAGWLPAAARERFTSLAARVRSGRLVRGELRGNAPVRRWRELLAGRLDRLPTGLRFALDLDDVTIDVDEANRLEHLSAALAYESDALEVRRASAFLNGGPLPELEVTFRGLSKLLDAEPGEREMTSSARALVGLTPLFEFLRGEPSDVPDAKRPTVRLHFEHLHHPALLWPLHDVQVQLVFQPDADGIRFELERCLWAGVFLDGEVDWTLSPDRRLAVDLVALDRAPEPPPAPDPDTTPAPPSAPARDPGAAPAPAAPHDEVGPAWVIGSFEVGEIDSPGWAQQHASGRFSAAGGALHLDDVAIELAPHGRLSGDLVLDLSLSDAVPYEARMDLTGADVATLIAQGGAKGQLVTGTLDLRAQLAGQLVPGRPLLHDASGEAVLEAREGAIQRSAPPVFALALASSSLNPFSSREELRYDKAGARFELEHGKMSTSGLDIAGPDIRLFASGTLDLSASPYGLDAEVVLFLFRQVDRALNLIPILNVLLLGENENLLAAYFQLVGTLEAPVASAKPLRTLAEGPGDVLTKGIPRVMKRGVDAIGGLFRRGDGEAAPQSEAETPPAPRSEAGAPPPPQTDS